ncbi:hypothetical protein NUW58_g7877 [Xylaria curta]|uniref:Uncharacterized protein n=1 Tax=Xylaria curta TaxID=42375 RepID=A0ACC1NFS4_9PEZI|nr:hypothetical protein NUW58_g7877 [Xylaria curta]
MSYQIPAANLPKITALRRELDYGDTGSHRYSAFVDDVRVFRKKFVTKNGVSGTSLHNWKSQEHQSGLSEMTAAYLDTNGNGLLFWPDDPSAENANKFQYSRDNAKIKKLMKQLFFRLNEQQYRNEKYKHKEKRESSPSLPNQKRNRTETPPYTGIGEDPLAIDLSSFDFCKSTPCLSENDAHLVTRAGHSGFKREFSSVDYDDDNDDDIDDDDDDDYIPLIHRLADTKTQQIEQIPTEPTQSNKPNQPKHHSAASASHTGKRVKFTNSSAEPDIIRKSPVPCIATKVEHATTSDHNLYTDQGSHTVTSNATEVPQAQSPAAAQECNQSQDQESYTAKPKIVFIYRLVLSRNPVPSYRKWRPARKLEETTFGQFIDEVTDEKDAKGLFFTVEGPGLKTAEEIRRGDELEFDSLRRLIKRTIKGQLGNRGPSSPPLVYEIEVELVRNSTVVSHVEIDEEEDFMI